jgi:hypothetical protein
MSGVETGIMKLRAAFSKFAGFEPPELLLKKPKMANQKVGYHYVFRQYGIKGNNNWL